MDLTDQNYQAFKESVEHGQILHDREYKFSGVAVTLHLVPGDSYVMSTRQDGTIMHTFYIRNKDADLPSVPGI